MPGDASKLVQKLLQLIAIEEAQTSIVKPQDIVTPGRHGGIRMLQGQKLVGAGDSYGMALTSWALVHGLVMLAIDGQLSGPTAPTAEGLALQATELLMFGMATAA